jgi:hypothetical protein
VKRGTRFSSIAVLTAAAALPAALRAQDPPGARTPPASEQQLQPSPWRALRIGKWATLTGAAGAAAWGFVTNGRAEDRFRGLELACESQPAICRDRLPDGSYRDAALEQMYQDVLRLDRRARIGLIAGQVGIATSVLLFLLDLDNERRPADIPFAPARLEVAPRPSGAIEFSVRVRY